MQHYGEHRGYRAEASNDQECQSETSRSFALAMLELLSFPIEECASDIGRQEVATCREMRFGCDACTSSSCY